MKYARLIIITLLLVTVSAFAGPKGEAQVYYAADNAPAIWVKNTGSEIVKFIIYGDSNATNSLVIGSTANTIAMDSTGNDTIEELEVSIAAATNSAGKKVLEVYRCSVAGTETVDDELMIQTTTLQRGSSGPLAVWDTSDAKHYRVFVPPSDGGSARNQLKIKRVLGDAKGTGNVTLKGYTISGLTATEISMSEVVSPIYVKAAVNATNVADSIAPGIIDELLDVQLGKDKGYLFSAVRATTGTTGGLGLTTEQR